MTLSLLKMVIEIVDFPINSMVIFHSELLVYQRVLHHSPSFSIILHHSLSIWFSDSNSFGKPVRHHFIHQTYPSPVVGIRGFPVAWWSLRFYMAYTISPVTNRMACQGFQDVQSFSQGRWSTRTARTDGTAELSGSKLQCWETRGVLNASRWGKMVGNVGLGFFLKMYILLQVL